MAIDEPLDAVEATFEAEERASSPLTRYIRPASEVLGLIPGLNLAVTALAKAASMFIEKQSQDRFEALLSVLADDMKRVNAKLADLGKTDQDREEFQRAFPISSWTDCARQSRLAPGSGFSGSGTSWATRIRKARESHSTWPRN